MILKRVAAVLVAYSFLLLPVAAQQRGLSQPTAKLVPTGSTSSAKLSRSAPSVSTTVVISQVYGGAGCGTANCSTYKNDYIEIFNNGSTGTSLNGWAVQYGSATGTTWQVTSLTNVTLQPGQYYLIAEGTGANGTNNIPTPDATGTIAMSATSAKVALTNSTTALSGACPTGGSIVDFVGYGTSANCSETAAAPAPSTANAVFRAGGGCTDTDNNSTDFTAAPANPRTTATALSPCTATSTDPVGAGSANPSNPAAGAAVLLTVTVTPGTNPTSSGLTVVADLSSIGGSAAQSFFDDGTNGDVTAGDNVFSFATTVAGGTSGGVKNIPFSVNDSLDRTTNGNFQLTVQGTSNPSGTGSANPSTVAAGGSTTLTVTVTPGTVPTSSGIAVTADLTSIGGSGSQAFTDSGDQVHFTYPATVSAGTSNGFKSLPFTITDAQARTGTGTIALTVGTNTDPATHTVAEHELMGNPTAAGATDNNDWLIERTQYVESYNCAKGIPNWVEWHLDTNWLGSTSRQDNYRADTAPPLPTSNCYIVQGTDYSGSGFDRGHDVPSADRTDSVASNSATFLMPNFIPQSPNNNQGIWNNMENYIRTQVSSGANEAYIWMGNAGQGGSGSNGAATTVANGHVVVPSYVWKIVMILPTGTNDLSRVTTSTRVFAVLTPNIQTADGLNGNWMTYVCPVSKIEQITGFNFFPNVPAATAAVLKQQIDPVIAKQTVAAGTLPNLTLAYPETYLTGNVTVTGNLTLGPETLNTTDTTGGNNYKLTLAPGATVTRTNGGMVTGSLERQYDGTNPSFTYPVGTLNGYSPVTANLTALGTNPSSLTVQAVQGPEPHASSPSKALQRYWTLTENGDLTANLTFNYLDIDVPSGTTESTLKLNKYETSFTQVPATQDTNANTVTTNSPVSQFSNWTLLPNITTAATVTVAGRVVDSSGIGVKNAKVVFADPYGKVVTTTTNAFGYYELQNVQSGSTFVAGVTARGIRYQERLVQVFGSLTNIDFKPQQ